MSTKQSGAPTGRQGSGQQVQNAERQQSQLGGGKDFAHKRENEGRDQNREQQDVRRQQGQQDVHGEGNYAASEQYNEATKAFTESGRVESAARGAAPRSEADSKEMAAAEAEGKRHAKGEDPALNRKSSPAKGSPTPRPGHEKE